MLNSTMFQPKEYTINNVLKKKYISYTKYIKDKIHIIFTTTKYDHDDTIIFFKKIYIYIISVLIAT